MEPETFKPGLEGVVAAQTAISNVDGLAGELIIGGYSLEEIAGSASFLEVCTHLWRVALGRESQLPDASTFDAIAKEVGAARSIPSAVLSIVKNAAGAPPMDALRMAVAALSLDDRYTDDESTEVALRRAIRITARIPTIIAAHERLRQGLSVIDPDPSLGHAENFLYMLRGQRPDAYEADALETYWVAVIDHGMNASTFTARVICSTLSDIYSAVTGAVGALKGPLHGGAPGPVLATLRQIETPDRAEPWVRNELASGRRVMGFGHRIYKVRDPRAEVLRRAIEVLQAKGGGDTALFDLAKKVEEIVLNVLEEKKPGHGIKTNVEFYTAVLINGLGLKSDQFSSIFAAGRVGGWTAHVLEQLGHNRLIRPSSVYIGPRGLKYIPISSRKALTHA